MDDDGAVALLDGGVVEDVWLKSGLEVGDGAVVDIEVSVTAFTGGLPHLKFVDGILAEVEPDGAVAAVLGVEGVVVDARLADILVEELVGVVLAEAVADGGLVGQPVVEVEVDDGVAAVLRVEGVVIHARGVDVLSEEGEGVVFADGFVDVLLNVGMDMDRNVEVDISEAVANVAGVGGVAEARRGDGVLRGGVAERLGGRPLEGVVFSSASGRDDVQCGGLTVAEVGLVGREHGEEARAVDADDDLGGAGAVALWVGDGDGEGLRPLQRNSLGGLRVGVGHHVGGFPVEVEGALRSRVGAQCCGGAVEDGGRRCRCGGHGHGIDIGDLGVTIYTSARSLHSESHGIFAGLGVVVADGLSVTCGAIAEVPLVAVDLVSRGGAGE